MINIRRLSSRAADFEVGLRDLTTHESHDERDVEHAVREIIDRVRHEGDTALVEYVRALDANPIGDAADLAVPADRIEAAGRGIGAAEREALEFAAERVRAYHERQRQESWRYEEADGTMLGQKITPMDRVGLYVPGGKAAYPSSVLMNAIPAKVAGVGEVVMTVPAPGGELADLVLAAAHIAGVDRVFTIGGAQAVAALAFGTRMVPRVDKIVGPGNVYVATAKRVVFGEVGIDMIAGPSEILVIADGHAPARWTAMDLFSQAEHDENARALLLSPDASYLEAVHREIERLLPGMERCDIIRRSLEERGALIEVRDLEEAVDLANRIAPEHLELSVAEPEPLVERVRHAGAIFVGKHSSEVVGDYCAGPNHVLPTAGTARFSSPLGVYDFQKRSSIIRCSPAGADALGRVASVLARGEGLTAHARSAEMRIGGESGETESRVDEA